MKTFFTAAALFTLVAPFVAASPPATRTLVKLDDNVVHKTNAERLASGLPLLAPRGRARGTRVKRQDEPSVVPGGNRMANNRVASQPEPTGSSTSVGFLQVTDGTTDETLGYFDGLSVSEGSADATAFRYSVEELGSSMDISSRSADSDNILAITAGPLGADLGSDLSTYLYAQRVIPEASTGAGSVSVEGLQTTVFKLDRATGTISVAWVNSDGTTPQTYMAILPSSGNLFVTGNPDVLRQFGLTAVNIKWVGSI